MTGQPALDRLAARMGVVDAYAGLDGVERRTSPATKRALLAAMGRAADNEIQAFIVCSQSELTRPARVPELRPGFHARAGWSADCDVEPHRAPQ